MRSYRHGGALCEDVWGHARTLPTGIAEAVWCFPHTACTNADLGGDKRHRLCGDAVTGTRAEGVRHKLPRGWAYAMPMEHIRSWHSSARKNRHGICWRGNVDGASVAP